MKRTARIRMRGGLFARGLFAAAVLSGLVLLCGSSLGAERPAGHSLEIQLNRALDGAPVPGLPVQVYRAGIPAGENPKKENPTEREPAYRLSPDFLGAGTGEVLSEDHPTAAEQLAAFAGSQSMTGTAAVSDSRGRLQFRDLPEGLYLVTLDRTGEARESDTRYEMNAFLVSVGGSADQGRAAAAPKVLTTVGVGPGTEAPRSSTGRTSGGGSSPGGGSGRVSVSADSAAAPAVLGESRGSGIPLPEVLGTSRLPKTGEPGAFSAAGRCRPAGSLLSILGCLVALLTALVAPGKSPAQAGRSRLNRRKGS